jgi:hypothetical protein
MKFVILGTLLDSGFYNYDLAANPASSKWLSGFVGGLMQNQMSIRMCGHCYSRVWPWGELRPGRVSYLSQLCENHMVRFLNLPGLRYRSMAREYWKVSNALVSNDLPDAIITYNPYSWHSYAARRLRAQYGIPWVCLNLDFDNVGDDWSQFSRDAGDADGHLFLSHWGYENAPVQHKIHLDSGVSKLPERFGSRDSSETVNVVYLGKLSKSGGLDVLLALPRWIQAKNVRFIYGGKGYPEAISRLNALVDEDSRVNFKGFVEDEDVAGLFECADVFINPRDPDDVVNDMVFPSKIMHYLQTGKTVVTTWTKGLDPIYRDLMLVAETAAVKDFVSATIEAVGETIEQRNARSARIADFLTDSRLWSEQARRFGVFMSLICKEFGAPVTR